MTVSAGKQYLIRLRVALCSCASLVQCFVLYLKCCVCIAGLNTAEINAIIAKLQQADPEAFVGKDITELRRELASASLNAIVDDSNATISLQVVTTELLESLDATHGPPGQPAPTPPGEQLVEQVFF